jgi:hypothetical protein
MNQQFDLAKGTNEFTCIVEDLFLKPGTYSMQIFLGNKYETLDLVEDPLDFEMPEYAFYPTGLVPDNSQGYLMSNHQWTINKQQ